MSKGVLRKTVSMTALFSFIYLAFTGIVMYVIPPGRIAYWADWRIFGMSKTMYTETHTMISMLFLVSMILHIWLNWRLLLSYMRDGSGRFIILTRETIAGILLAAVFVGGTIFMVPPFATVVNKLTDIKEGYGGSLGNPPYPHAELTKLGTFVKRMNIDTAEALSILSREGIRFIPDDTLKTIAEENATDPAHIYALLKQAQKSEPQDVHMYEGVQNGVDMSKYDSMMGTGMGKKTVKDSAGSAGISVDEAIKRLAKYSISAAPDDRLKDLGAKADMVPIDIYIIIDSGVKPE